MSKRAIDRLSAALRSNDAMAPSEIVDACCAAVADALDLATGVVIDEFQGVSRSIAWRRVDANWDEMFSAEQRAWRLFADPSRSSSDSLASAATELAPADVSSPAVGLAPPLNGIFYCGSNRGLDGADLALLQYMVMRLSFALYRYNLQWERP